MAESYTLSVPEAGAKYLGLKRKAAYAAAARGDIPAIKVGKYLRVPIAAMEAMLTAASRPTKAA
jgi:excisionase family DNA binding protein